MAGRERRVAHVWGRAASRVPRRLASSAAVLFACLIVTGVGLLGAPRAPNPPQSQKPPAANQQVPTFRTEARLVRVDAYVTADGRAVEDLRAGDFDVLEDGVRQKVETFEYVRKGQVVAGRAPNEPDIIGRNFVLFVDTYHLPWVDRERLEHRERAAPDYQPEPFRATVVLPPAIPGDEMFREALREVVKQVVGDQDRVAVLTPDMWAASLTFEDKRSAIEELGTRSLAPYTTGQRPPELNHFEACFPDGPNIEEPMRVRYRLYRTFTALQELIANLELVREERKGVLLVTRGWDPPPRISSYRDPRSGMLSADDTVCHTERLALAEVDFQNWLRTITNEAKRANVAFYALYANPLVTYSREGDDIDEDTRKYQRQWGDLARPGEGERMLYNDFPAILHDRMLWHDTLTHLSKDTNGRAILTKDDFEKGLTEIADGLASYYLLGYYSTNTKKDGAFRRITVDVKRRGTTVRARPGYRAVIPAEAEAAEAAARPDLVPPAILAALSPLARMRADVPFHLAAAPEWDQAAGGWRVRVVGELDSQQARSNDWRQGWRAELTVTPGNIVLAGPDAISMKGGQPAFSRALPSQGTLTPGQYDVRMKALTAEGETVFDEHASVTVPATSLNEAMFGPPLFSRRLNAPRTEFQPTAELSFSRREILLVDVPVAASGAVPTLRLVDRQGRALGTEMPTTTADRAGTRVVTVMIPLSNLAPGDYVIEIAATDKPDRKVYAAFRVVP